MASQPLPRALRTAIVVDFETLPIAQRPKYPPAPVGVAIKWPGRKARYYAFGHIGHKNPDTEAAAKRALKLAWLSGNPLLFHNAKFDLAVATEKWGLPMPHWSRIHDTAILLFLRDPRAASFKLKPNAVALANYPADARDAVVAWLVANQPMRGVKLTATEKPAKSKKPGAVPLVYAGAAIAYAPPALVAPYACDDCGMTAALAAKLGTEIQTRGMSAAYDRERALLVPILAMERQGVPVDLPKLEVDVAALTASLVKVDAWLCRKTKAPARTKTGGLTWDSPKVFAQYLIASGKADAVKLGLTKTNKMATNKGALSRGITDPKLLTVLRYRSRLVNSLRGFMRTWLRMAQACGGRIHTTWNTTRKDDAGARTGRLSSTPNFQNIMKRHVKLFPGDPPAWWLHLGFADLPHLRSYVLPERGHILVDRDYAQQELRILAHYTGGELLAKYLSDPTMDVHQHINDVVNKILGREIPRELIKPIVFGILYGMGKPGMAKIAEAFHIALSVVLEIRDAVKEALPGIKAINEDLKRRAHDGEPIRTWGGRQYYVEAPREIDGHLRTFDYRLLNLLIQGSAADCTKQAVLELISRMPAAWRLLLTVHDEIVLSVPVKQEHKAHKLLASTMCSVKFKAVMLSDGKSGATWSSLSAYDKGA